MKVIEGVNWTMLCTPRFDQTVAFFRNILGLRLAEEGVPVTDTQFSRYALLRPPNGGTLEIVEPADEAVSAVYTAPIISFKVDDLAQARHELEGQGVEFVAPIFRTRDNRMGWTYLRVPDGHIYQLWDEALMPDQDDTSMQP